MPPKYRYSGADMRRWTRRHGVTIKRPSGHGPDRLNKGVFRAGDRRAHQRGVFGVPTMMIGEEMWWGNDRLGFVEEFLAA